KLGFETVNTQDGDVEGQVKAILGGEGADIAFECVGKSSTAENAIEAVGAFGTVVLVGNPEGDMAFEKNIYWKILRQQIVVRGTWNSSYSSRENDWQEALSYMAKDPELFAALVTQTFPLERYQEAMDCVRDPNQVSLKVMFTTTI
ncbi:MAG: zinc-binding dehydrogenase, partial [Clostridiales bacterium]|nr:zinc-binding dehydrogenase [Clostridiales bacterium]